VGFKFRYETLLFYRGHLKEKAEIELSLTQRKLRRCRELLEESRDSLRRTNNDLGQGLKAKIPSHTLKNYSGYIEALKTKMEMQETDIAESEKIVAEKLKHLVEKTKQYKIFERLKERDFQKWTQRQHLIDQKELSEAALLRHGKEFL
jgi:flagellar protein FliJ